MTITIDKAVEILESPQYGRRWPTPPKERDAIRLGIEALKGVQRYRQSFNEAYIERLPGETEE